MSIRIGKPEIQLQGDMLELSASIQGAALPLGLPERLVYHVKADSGLAFSDLSDTFLVAAMPLAMKLGQPLEIAGTLSLRLAHGIKAYQDTLAAWFPKTYRPVPFECEQVNDRAGERRPVGVGCCFSGGLDSFYAVRELLPPLNRFDEYQISHAVMVNGFDQIVDPDRTGPSRQLEHIFSEALGRWNVRLVMIHANLKLFRDAILEQRELVTSYGSALAGCGHALAPEFGRFNLSGHATYRYEDLKPLGCHPALDHHLSSDQMDMIHLGANLSRSQKLEHLLDERPVRETLRVCFKQPAFDAATGDILNCCVCEKCARTIIMLDILGRLNEFSTFRNHPPIEAYRQRHTLERISPLFKSDLKRLAERHQHSDWLALLKNADGYGAAS